MLGYIQEIKFLNTFYLIGTYKYNLFHLLTIIGYLLFPFYR